MLTAAALMVASPAAAQKTKTDHLYGPPPVWEQYRQIAEAEITARLLDPESARISWMGSYHKGEFKPFLQARVAGYIGCGTVNARNRMGGYTGASAFVVVIDYDRVLFAEIDSRSTGMIGQQCQEARQAGLLPPLPSATATLSASDTTLGSVPAATSPIPSATGLSLRMMPDGAYVSAVAPASRAAAAGLKPGMVIATVNAIPLAGMGEPMLKVVDAAGGKAVLGIIGGTTITLGNP